MNTNTTPYVVFRKVEVAEYEGMQITVSKDIDKVVRVQVSSKGTPMTANVVCTDVDDAKAEGIARAVELKKFRDKNIADSKGEFIDTHKLGISTGSIDSKVAVDEQDVKRHGIKVGYYIQTPSMEDPEPITDIEYINHPFFGKKALIEVAGAAS